MALNLADRSVSAARCPEGRKDVLLFDDALPGFGLRVTSGGTRTFIFQYRVEAKVRRMVLGTFGAELTTAQARKKAESLRGQVRDARDPVAERRAVRIAAAKAEAAEKAARAAATYTVDAMITHWAADHLAERSDSYANRVPAELRRALAEWKKAPADGFTQADAVRTLDAIKTERGPIAANRLRAVARACWGWAVKRGALASNPWEATPRPARETARERVLSDAEVGALWTAAAGLDAPMSSIVRLLLLTGQRRGEVAGMQWDELHLDAAMWAMPGNRTKNGKPHSVPLPAEAVALLLDVKRRRGAVLVFEGARETVPSGFGKTKARLDAAMVKAAKEGGRKLPAWTLHDIRRTVATGLQRLGVRLEVTEALLNHVSGSRSGIVGVYQRHGWEREKAEAVKAWSAHLLRCAEAKPKAAEDAAKVADMAEHRARRGKRA
ncbi:tyrosine-type recombinase/integrase [Paeniroseomonas aquatica]|uniref:Site-specific integrase n=1 Tax=Paeniroseomonas aquatica TaxID=373043 RepID=A0ABT8AHD0_9PROT|nr:site-specific integrase [Paeniroseomonas aquatica]MDN3568961.1 site-specific integrase [Paeniroseomonas aquatica]